MEHQIILDNLVCARQQLQEIQYNGNSLKSILISIANSLIRSSATPNPSQPPLAFSNAELRLDLSNHIEAFLGHIDRHLKELAGISADLERIIVANCSDMADTWFGLQASIASIRRQLEDSRNYTDITILLSNTIRLSNLILREQLLSGHAPANPESPLLALKYPLSKETPSELFRTMQQTNQRVQQLFLALESEQQTSAQAADLREICAGLGGVFMQIKASARQPGQMAI